MNRLKYFLCLVPLVALGALTGPQWITLMWDRSPGDDGTYVYRIYQTNAVDAAKPWILVATVTNTNAVPLQVNPAGAWFFYCTASNFWGESDPSNVASTPPLPSGGNLTIRRGK